MPDKPIEIEDLLTDDSFVRWITGGASEAEIKYWENWVSKDEEHKKRVTQAKKLIRLTESDGLAIPDPQRELQKFEASVYHFKQRSKASNKIGMSKGRQSKSSYAAVAAALVILVVSIGFFLTFENNNNTSSQEQQVQKREYQTSNGEKKPLELSDGSVIILNANSNLRYPSSIQSGQNIDVWLKGEAYFNITHPKGIKQRVFRVHTADGTVEVLGTKFAVKTSSEGTRTVLEQGKVRIEVDNDTSGSDTALVMKPNERAQFASGSGSINLQTVNTSVYTSWINDQWHFDQTPLPDVTQRIEDIYGVEVNISTEALKQRLLSGSIKSTNLDILRKALSKILDKPVTLHADSTMVIGA